FRFHVLGGSEWKEIIGHKFFERHIKEVFDIDVQITFDSSTYFKTICLGRYTFRPMDEYIFRKLLLRPENLYRIDNRERNRGIYKTESELFYEMVNEAVTPYGIKPINPENTPLYVDGTMPRIVYTYGLFQQLALFKNLEEWC